MYFYIEIKYTQIKLGEIRTSYIYQRTFKNAQIFHGYN